jgi:hypothetical protein
MAFFIKNETNMLPSPMAGKHAKYLSRQLHRNPTRGKMALKA